MAKKESTFLNMTLTLLCVALASSAALGYVYEATKGPIAESKLAKKVDAIKNVVPSFTNNPVEEQFTKQEEGGVIVFYPAKDNGSLVGVAVETFSTQGYGGTITLMAGFLPDGTIHNIAVLEQAETPGLGDKMDPAKSDFTAQFSAKNPKDFMLAVSKDGGDVDAITAATISSRAFCDAVVRAYAAFKKEYLQ